MSQHRRHAAATSESSFSASCNVQEGQWATSKGFEKHVQTCKSFGSPKTRCDDTHELKLFRPHSCNGSLWPSARSMGNLAHAFDRSLGTRSLRFIGDSLTQHHYEFITGCLLDCNHSYPQRQPMVIMKDPRVRRAWMSYLKGVGYQETDINGAFGWLRQNNGKEVHHLGCHTRSGGHVDFVRINRLHPSGNQLNNVVAAMLHALVYLPTMQEAKRAMTPRDLVVMNFGIHRDLDIAQKVSAVLDWWSAERAARRAPHLLWRQTSPQHWPGPRGVFRGFGDLEESVEHCTTQPASQLEDAFADYDLNVTALIRERNVAWADVLPTFRATWERVDDHPPLRVGMISMSGSQTDQMILRAQARNNTLVDCTHVCFTGSVAHFWTQALVAHLAFTDATHTERHSSPAGLGA